MPDTPDDSPPRRPRGKALRLTAEQLDSMADVRAEDVPAARAKWRADAPKWAKRLPDAVEA